MSPDILLKIKNWIEEEGFLNQTDLDKFIKKLSYYGKDKWIYPGVIKRQLGLPIQNVYEILNFLKTKGILEINYETYCYSCNRTSGEVYQSISEIPELIRCDNCDTDLDLLNNVIMIYKVLEDGK